MASRKGISPLIAAVLLIAFTMAVATLAGPWITNLLQNTQEGTTQQAIDINRASELGLDLMSASFNRSSDELNVVIQNTGEPINNNTNISLGLIGDNVTENQVYDIDLSSREITTLSLPINRTYPLETIQADMTHYSVSTESGIKCTPTKGMIGYWTFNDEQTKNGYATDLSGKNNSLSIENGANIVSDGIVGSSYKFDGIDDYLKSKKSLLDNKSNFSLVGWAKSVDNSSQQSLYGQNNAIEFFLSSTNDIRLWTSNGDNTETNYDNYGSFEMLTALGNGSNLMIYRDTKKLTVGGIETSDYGSSADKFKIGRGVQSSSSGPFEGKIDEVRIYNRSLQQEEIQRLYQIRSKNWAVNSCKLVN